MGYAKDLGTGTVAGIHEPSGYPVDAWGHLLDPNFDGYTPWGIGTKLYNLTSPYGHLYFACGTGDDFHCFDYGTVDGPRGEWIALHSVVNSETGSFIQDGEYHIMPINTGEEMRAAARMAFSLTAGGDEWCMHNDLRHHRKGWNQSPDYFGRAVFCNLFDTLTYKWVKGQRKRWVTERMKRFGGKRLDTLINQTIYAKES